MLPHYMSLTIWWEMDAHEYFILEKERKNKKEKHTHCEDSTNRDFHEGSQRGILTKNMTFSLDRRMIAIEDAIVHSIPNDRDFTKI